MVNWLDLNIIGPICLALAVIIYLWLNPKIESSTLSAATAPEVERQEEKPAANPPAAPASVEPRPFNWFEYLMFLTTHIQIVGKTEAGKSTLAEAIAIARSYMGQVVIISPVVKPSDWGNMGRSVVGRGENYEAIRQCLAALWEERHARAKEYAESGYRGEPLTIIADEIPLIVENLGKQAQYFFDQMSMSGRHYNMRLIRLTQSDLIKDVGGSVALRENYTTVYLGNAALNVRPDLKGTPWPAVVERGGELIAFNRDWIPALIQNGFSWSGNVYKGFNKAALWQVPPGFQVPAGDFTENQLKISLEPGTLQFLLDAGITKSEIAKLAGGNRQKTFNIINKLLETPEDDNNE